MGLPDVFLPNIYPLVTSQCSDSRASYLYKDDISGHRDLQHKYKTVFVVTSQRASYVLSNRLNNVTYLFFTFD